MLACLIKDDDECSVSLALALKMDEKFRFYPERLEKVKKENFEKMTRKEIDKDVLKGRKVGRHTTQM